MHLPRKLGALLLGTTTACVPAVVHGPRVDPGPSVGISAAVTTSPPRDYSNPYSLGPFGVDVGYGLSGDGWSPALRVGAQLNLLPPRFDPDAYVQLPSKMLLGMDGGIGIVGATIGEPTSRMPYAQLGAVGADRAGFYVMQGYLREDPERHPATALIGDDAWVTTIAYQRARDPVVWRLFATGVFGRPLGAVCSGGLGDCRRFRRPQAFFLGGAWELQTRRLPRRDR